MAYPAPHPDRTCTTASSSSPSSLRTPSSAPASHPLASSSPSSSLPAHIPNAPSQPTTHHPHLAPPSAWAAGAGLGGAGSSDGPFVRPSAAHPHGPRSGERRRMMSVDDEVDTDGEEAREDAKEEPSSADDRLVPSRSASSSSTTARRPTDAVSSAHVSFKGRKPTTSSARKGDKRKEREEQEEDEKEKEKREEQEEDEKEKEKKEKEIKRRSSKACDGCRRAKCKCELPPGAPATAPCTNCEAMGVQCTFLEASRKRGPPKGYIEAIESRLHRMEGLIAVLSASSDPRARGLLTDLVGKQKLDEVLRGLGPSAQAIVADAGPADEGDEPTRVQKRRVAERGGGGKWKNSWWSLPLNEEERGADEARREISPGHSKASASASAESSSSSQKKRRDSFLDPNGDPLLPNLQRVLHQRTGHGRERGEPREITSSPTATTNNATIIAATHQAAPGFSPWPAPGFAHSPHPQGRPLDVASQTTRALDIGSQTTAAVAVAVEHQHGFAFSPSPPAGTANAWTPGPPAHQFSGWVRSPPVSSRPPSSSQPVQPPPGHHMFPSFSHFAQRRHRDNSNGAASLHLHNADGVGAPSFGMPGVEQAPFHHHPDRLQLHPPPPQAAPAAYSPTQTFESFGSLGAANSPVRPPPPDGPSPPQRRRLDGPGPSTRAMWDLSPRPAATATATATAFDTFSPPSVDILPASGSSPAAASSAGTSRSVGPRPAAAAAAAANGHPPAEEKISVEGSFGSALAENRGELPAANKGNTPTGASAPSINVHHSPGTAIGAEEADAATAMWALTHLADGLGQLSLDEHGEVRYHGLSSGLKFVLRSVMHKGNFWRFGHARSAWPPVRMPPAGHKEATQVQVRAEAQAQAKEGAVASGDGVGQRDANSNRAGSSGGRRSKTEEECIVEAGMQDALPDVEMQDHLLDLYWTYVHPVLPVVYKPQFVLDLVASRQPSTSSSSSSGNEEAVDDGASRKSKVSKLLLLAMLSVAARYSDRVRKAPKEYDGEFWDAGDEYMDKAKAIINRDYETARLATVQTLLLLSYREVGVGAMSSSWTQIGMAIRMAQDLGLHRDVDSWAGASTYFSHADKQARKRVWSACLILDKYVTMYLGRPMGITEQGWDTGLANEDETDETELWRPLRPSGLEWGMPPVTAEDVPEQMLRPYKPSGQTNAISCFNRLATLSAILAQVQAKLYCIRNKKPQALSALDHALAEWYLSLPRDLQYNPSAEHVPNPHVLLLQMAFYCSLILLHRPFIPGPDAQLQAAGAPSRTTSYPSHNICTTAAHALTSIAMTFRKTYSFRQAPPFLSYYIRTAAIHFSYDVHADPEWAGPAKRGFVQCMSALKELGVIWPSAGRAWDLLDGVVDVSEVVGMDIDRPLGPIYNDAPIAIARGTKRGPEDGPIAAQVDARMGRPPFSPNATAQDHHQHHHHQSLSLERTRSVTTIHSFSAARRRRHTTASQEPSGAVFSPSTATPNADVAGGWPIAHSTPASLASDSSVMAYSVACSPPTMTGSVFSNAPGIGPNPPFTNHLFFDGPSSTTASFGFSQRAFSAQNSFSQLIDMFLSAQSNGVDGQARDITFHDAAFDAAMSPLSAMTFANFGDQPLDDAADAAAAAAAAAPPPPPPPPQGAFKSNSNNNLTSPSARSDVTRDMPDAMFGPVGDFGI